MEGGRELNRIGLRAKRIAEAVVHLVRDTDPRAFDALVGAVCDANQVFVVGAGRTGLMAKAFAVRLAQMGIKVHWVGESTAPPIQPKDLLVACSASGRTRSVCAMADRASEAGARIVGITTDPDAPLGARSDMVLCFSPAEAEANRLATTEELAIHLLFDLLVEETMNRLGMTDADLLKRHANLE